MSRYAAYWNRAPDWVRFIATDPDGLVYGFSHRPEVVDGTLGWVAPTGQTRMLISPPGERWDDSLEERPTC